MSPKLACSTDKTLSRSLIIWDDFTTYHSGWQTTFVAESGDR